MKADSKLITGRCKGCDNVKMISGGRWSFAACYHKPYAGKWCKEIKECPKVQKNKK